LAVYLGIAIKVGRTPYTVPPLREKVRKIGAANLIVPI
jgi:hypothetical protein